MDGKHRWRVQNTRMQTGYVPSNYVRKEKPSIFDSIKKKVCFLLKNGNKLFHLFFYPRWRVAGTKAQEAELSPPQTQVLCTVFPLPLIQVRSSSLSYKWARSSSFFMNLLSNVTLYYVWTATNESFLHNTISTTIFSIPLLHPILLLLRYESYLSLFSSNTFFSTPLFLLRYEIFGQPATNHYRKLGANILGNCEIQLPGKKVAADLDFQLVWILADRSAKIFSSCQIQLPGIYGT